MILSSFNTICTDITEFWYTLGLGILLLKFSFPLLIIGLGMVDLGKTIVSSNNDTIRKTVKRLIKRIAFGILIFFIPTLILLIFDIFNEYTRESNSFNVCRQCVLHPTRKECREAREY